MEEVLLRLVQRGIAAYPLHDCLIGKVSDEAVLIEVLQDVFEEKLGRVPYLEIEYSLTDNKVIAPPIEQQDRREDDLDSINYSLMDDDCLIDEEDSFL